FTALGLLELHGHLDAVKPLTAWRILFLIGIAPAALVIFIHRRLQEPASWRQARDDAASGIGKKLGSYAELFGEGWIRRHALLGMVLSFAGIVGLWAIGFFSYDLQQTIFRPTFQAEAQQLGLTGAEQDRYIRGQNIIWAGVTSLMLNVGAFFGMSAFSWLAQHIGRRR